MLLSFKIKNFLSYKDENHKHFVEIRNYLYGKWESISTEDFIDFINGNNKLLGIDIKIYLNTENLDQKNLNHLQNTT